MLQIVRSVISKILFSLLFLSLLIVGGAIMFFRVDARNAFADICYVATQDFGASQLDLTPTDLFSDIDLSPKTGTEQSLPDSENIKDATKGECVETRTVLRSEFYPRISENADVERSQTKTLIKKAASAEASAAIRPLQISLLNSRRANFRREVYLVTGWGYVLETTDESDLLMIPVSKGFVSDFASIPWGAHFLINPFGNHAEAAILHDWLYAYGEGSDGRSSDRYRKFADLVFYDVMLKDGVNPILAKIMYSAVRLNGAVQDIFDLQSSYGAKTEWRFVNSDHETAISAKQCKPNHRKSAIIDRVEIPVDFSLEQMLVWTNIAANDEYENYSDIFLENWAVPSPYPMIPLPRPGLYDTQRGRREFIAEVLNYYDRAWSLFAFQNYGHHYYDVYWLHTRLSYTCILFDFISEYETHNADSIFAPVVREAKSMLLNDQNIDEVLSLMRAGFGYSGLDAARRVNPNLQNGSFYGKTGPIIISAETNNRGLENLIKERVFEFNYLRARKRGLASFNGINQAFTTQALMASDDFSVPEFEGANE